MRGRALAALVGGAVLIGFVPLGVRLSGLPPVATGFWRFYLTIPLWGFLASRIRDAAPERKGLLFAAGAAFAADIGCYFLSIRATTAANATLLSNAAPVVVLLAALLLWRERPSRLAVLGTLVATVGAILLVAETAQLGGQRLKGDVLGLVSAGFYATYQLVVVRLRRDQPAARVMFWVAATGALVVGVWAALRGDQIVPTTERDWAVLIALALVTQVGGQGLITWAMAHLPATFSSVVLLVQPLVAALLGVLVLHEPVTAWLAVGGGLILCGIILASRR